MTNESCLTFPDIFSSAGSVVAIPYAGMADHPFFLKKLSDSFNFIFKNKFGWTALVRTTRQRQLVFTIDGDKACDSDRKLVATQLTGQTR